MGKNEATNFELERKAESCICGGGGRIRIFKNCSSWMETATISCLFML
jgi:hypothetical protein